MRKFFLIILFFLTVNSSFSQVTFIKNLENQNVAQEKYDSLTNTVYFLPYADSLNTYSLWFNFGVAGFRKDTLLTFVSNFKQRFFKPNFPVYTYDHKKYFSVKSLDYGKKLRVQFLPEHDTVYFSTGFPYSYSDYENFFNAHSDSENIREKAFLEYSDTLKMPYLTIGDKRYLKRGKKLIWIICRQHAFESVANYVMQGMLEYLFSKECAKKLLRKYTFKIVPMVDIRNVVLGQSGRMGLPVDLNRDWDKTIRPEIKILKNEITKTANYYRYYMFWDIHGTFPGGDIQRNFSYFSLADIDKKRKNIHKYWDCFFDFAKFVPTEISDFQKGYDGLTADWWNHLTFPNLEFSTTLETDWNVNHKFDVYTVEDYYEIGRNMIRALEKYR